MLFTDRADAGRQLARRLLYLRGADVVVLGLSHGGVPVAAEVARELRAPLEVIVVRKLGVPFQPECGFGAISEDGARVIDDRVVRRARLTSQAIASVEARERAWLDRRLGRLRGARPPVPLVGRTAVVVDDGIATGSTVRVACLVARARGASRVVVAVPVGAAEALASLRRDADEVVCPHSPPSFAAIGDWYQDFSQICDAAVADLLCQKVMYPELRAVAPDPAEVTVDAGGVLLSGSLVISPDAGGLVVFVHGSGSSKNSPRNRFVAAGLNRVGLGTLLIDLLTPDEELSRSTVFNVPLLEARLATVTRWLGDQPGMAETPIGFFGASTGVAAALAATMAKPQLPVAAIVSRGGRPDLVGGRLPQIQTPTLLIVGGADTVVLGLNQRAQAQLKCESQLVVVPGATNLFREPGALGQVTDLAAGWFLHYLVRAGTTAAAA